MTFGKELLMRLLLIVGAPFYIVAAAAIIIVACFIVSVYCIAFAMFSSRTDFETAISKTRRKDNNEYQD